MNRVFWHGMDPVLCLRDVSGHPLYGFGLVRKKALVKILGRALALMAIFASCVLAAPALAFAAEPIVIEVGSGAEFDNAVATINGAAGGEYVIKLTDDFESGGASFSSACATTILGGGHTITLGQYSSLFVAKGTQLNLGSADDGSTLTISGGNKQSNDVPGLLYVQGSCNMYSGVTVSDRKGENYFGGGVTVQGGTFHMYGGTIKNCGVNGGSMCYGGGVAVVYGGSFVMDAGEIADCNVTANWEADWDPRMISALGGGVFVSGGSSFVMNGGTISGNKSSDMGGGVAVVASIDEVLEGFGTLKSSAEILGGTVENNEAHDGAGVFASGYYYAGAYGLCADTPSVGVQDEQGLRVNGAKNVNNKADEQDGRGGGVFVVWLNSPAVAEIANTEINGNRAAVGGGVMSYGNPIETNIKGCTITGNTATMYGGGLAAKENERDGAVVVSNTKLCNNIADIAASDVYFANTPAKLSSAKGMSERYLGEPDDVTNKRIDGWYVDGESSRYVNQSKDERSEYSDFADINSEDEVCLIAAASGSLSEFRAKYEFQSATPGMSLPDDVLKLTPEDANTYVTDEVLSAIAPAQRVVEVSGGTWTFKGYDRESVTADATTADSEGNVTFVGVWEFTQKTSSPSGSGNGGQNGTNDAPGAGSAQGKASSGIPQTGDVASTALYLALIASAALLLSARWLSKR